MEREFWLERWQAGRTAFHEGEPNLGVSPEVDTPGDAGGLLRYRAPDVEIFVGDLFALPAVLLGPVDAVYDRAALVALPREMRARYVPHLIALTECAPQLLISYEYAQEAMKGPPFSVSDAEVRQRYRERYELTQLGSEEVEGGLKGVRPVWEKAWLLAEKGAPAG